LTVVDWCRKRGGRESDGGSAGDSPHSNVLPATEIPQPCFCIGLSGNQSQHRTENMKLQWNEVSLNIKTEISPRKDVARLDSWLPTFRSQPKPDKGEDLRLLILYGET
jgi:hypothetical protein